ncbi:ABC transporter ATP-binding protein [Trinickia acidisoli]|uniref:ABC transporter ATP-binding protein n=1 Tax=Trinickia acidisoli TaxID=2767482 RepID=UPI001A8D7556|nr:ABC transporter ATP-binding protein [Trinickia acidisoli]
MTRKKFDLGGQTFKDVFRFTFTHWLRQRWRIGGILAVALLTAAADVLTPLFAGHLVDALAGAGHDKASALHSALAPFATLIALALGSAALRYLTYSGIIALTLRMMSEIAGDAFHRVQRLSTDWHANSFAGSTVRKITRGMWALDMLNDTLLLGLLPSVVMLVGATVLLGVHWPIMGVVVGTGAVLFIGITLAMTLGLVAPAARLGNAWDTRMGGALADTVTCNAVVKAFGAEVREEQRFSRVVGKWRDRTRRAWVRGTFNASVQNVMLTAMQAAMLGVGLLLWLNGRAGVGDIAFALTMFLVLQGYLRDVATLVRQLQRSVNDMEELAQLTHQPLGIEDKPGAGLLVVERGAIRFEHVTFRYDGHAAPLYADFSVRIAPGERVGLIGHSGSGKTTFIKLIQRLYDVSEGKITIDGQNIADVKQASLRAQIAIVQQEPLLFHRSLAENIAYARPGASQVEIERAARYANAHEFIVSLPNGYDTLVGERGVKLSGGERQRVAIARAFLADAPVLIFDEATSSLDSESEALIQQAMERLMVGRTTLVIAHRLSTVRALDRLLVLDKGCVVEEGNHDTLIRLERGLYRRLFERQALELTKGLDVQPSYRPHQAATTAAA